MACRTGVIEKGVFFITGMGGGCSGLREEKAEN